MEYEDSGNKKVAKVTPKKKKKNAWHQRRHIRKLKPHRKSEEYA